MAGAPQRDPAPAHADTVGDASLAALGKLGVEPEAAEDYVRRGDPEGAVFDAVLLPGRLERTVTPKAIEQQGGLSAEAIADFVEAFGLPRPGPDDPAFTPEEARVLVALSELEDLWPPDFRVQVARATGPLLAGIARAEVQAFQAYTEPHVRAEGGDTDARLRSLKSAIQRLLPLADPILTGVHRRWIEHELGQRAVTVAEQRAGGESLPGAVEVTFLFCDLKDFTAYAESQGDAAAIDAIDSFFEVVAHERGANGRLVKLLGDGAMLAYGNPAQAVAAGARVIVGMRSSEAPGVHASVHRGIAIARSGDYFGGAVNLAARLLSFAETDELVATVDIVQSCDDAFEWTPAGERTIRGVGAPLMVYKLASLERAAAYAA